MKKSLIILTSCLAFWSCSQDTILQEPEQQTAPTSLTDTYKVSLDEALSVAENAFADMGAPKTRSSMVESVEIIRGDKTRATENLVPDTLLYLVNYSNDGGFAILGADKRLEPIYAISDEGHFETSFFEEHPGLALFKANMDEMIEEALTETRSSATIIGWPTTKYETYGPFLSVPQRRWHQRSPFNDFTPYSSASNSHHVVGCVPIAVASVMAYYSWPLEINSTTCDWESLNVNPLASHASRRLLLSTISNSSNLNVKYKDEVDNAGAWYSTANSYYTLIKRTLQNMNYRVTGDFQSYTASTLFTYAKSNPILARGVTPQGEGHVWVIDGVMRQMQYQNGIYAPDAFAIPMFHCSWGWTNGLANGFFIWKTQTGFGPMPDAKDDTDTSTGTNSYYFNTGLVFLTQFVPNK